MQFIQSSGGTWKELSQWGFSWGLQAELVPVTYSDPFIQVSFSSFLEDSTFFPNTPIIHGLDMGTSTEEIVYHIQHYFLSS